MLYKIGLFGGAAIIAVLSIQNIAVSTNAFILLNPSASAGFLVLLSAGIGMAMGYCAPYVFSANEKADDSYSDF